MTRIHESHTGGVVKIGAIQGRWGAVPEALFEDQRLGLDTRAVAGWLSTRPEGWQISVFHLRKRLGIGKDKWQRMANELVAAGYLYRSCHTGRGGRRIWEIVFSAVPGVIHNGACSTVAGSPGSGSPGGGTDGHIDISVGKIKDESLSKRDARAKTHNADNPKPPAPSGRAGPAPQQPVNRDVGKRDGLVQVAKLLEALQDRGGTFT